MSLLARAGAALAVTGVVVFLVAGTQGFYHLEPAALAAASPQIAADHRQVVLEELQALGDRWYSSTAACVADVQRKLAEASERLGDPWRISELERQEVTLAVLRASSRGVVSGHLGWFCWASLGLASLGALMLWLSGLAHRPAGVAVDGTMQHALRARGWAGMALGGVLVVAYVLLYFQPEQVFGWVRLADAPSRALRGVPADRWFLYGLLYTLAVLVMGVRMLVNHRRSRHQLWRTASVMFFQLGFAFLLPMLLARLNAPEVDLKSAWPLDYSLFFTGRLDGLLAGGAPGLAVLAWSVALALLVVPLMAVFVGKRWYCSWVCGCGGLAETAGDPFRHLSDKRLVAWRFERYSVHTVLALIVLLSAGLLLDRATGWLGDFAPRAQHWYGFAIGSVFAGVVGTGFYPLMGNRVWCRLGCPLAAVLGLVQRFASRFRITTNGGQCISCGNCSTYCEMGIDVRWYAQRGQDVVRASCVGCGVCATVCPRGVLRLENGPVSSRVTEPRDLVQLGRR